MGREAKINIAALLRAKLIAILSIGVLGFAMPAAASYLPFNTSVNMNVGIGSASPGQSLDVKGTVRAIGFIAGAGGITLGGVNNTSWPAGGANYWNYSGVGNIGVSTTAAVGIGTTFIGGTGEGALSVMNGNVGIGTWVPGTVGPSGFSGIGVGVSLDVESANSAGFAVLVNNSAGDGIVAFDSLGNGAALANGNNAGFAVTGIDNAGDAGGLGASSSGIDAALYGQGLTYGLYALGPMNYLQGNVGIGTLMPANQLVVNGAVGIGTANSSYVTTLAPAGGMIVQGNVGIGSLTPGQVLDVHGTIRMTGLTLTGNGAASGNVLVGNGVGVGTWMPSSTLGITGGSGTNYWLLNGGSNVGINTTQAVGIGTSFVGGASEAKLSIMNGNVGIGTWVPGALLQLGNATTGSGGGASFGINIGASGANLYSAFGNNSDLETDASVLYFSQNPATIYGAGGAMNIEGVGGATQSTSVNLLSHSSFTATSGDQNGVDVFETFAPTSGTSTYESLEVTPTINQTGGASGITRGIWVGSALTSAHDYRAIETDYGNVGIGTISGNLGIGSQWPGQRLDVNGTARMSGFTLTGNGAASGNVLVGNGVGVGTWMPASTLGVSGGAGTNYWLLNGGTNVGINTTQAVGIGTSFVGGTGEATLSVMNGNVGIGTWAPDQLLTVNGLGDFKGNTLTIGNNNDFARLSLNDNSTNAAVIQWTNASNNLAINNYNGSNIMVFNPSGNVGIGTSAPIGGLAIMSGNVGIGTWVVDSGALIINTGNNVGIGTIRPGQALDVNGTVRMSGFTLTGNGAANGNVLVGNGVGVGTWMPSSTLGITGGSGTNYWLLNGGNNVGINTTQAVGIGTSFVGGVGEAALSVMNGNVGIGTWLPSYPFQISGAYGEMSLVGAFSNSALIHFGYPSSQDRGRIGYSISTDDLYLSTQSVIDFDKNLLPLMRLDSNGNLGIGTTTPAGGLIVMNGNVGIGTWVPAVPFQVNGAIQNVYINTNGNLGIGTFNGGVDYPLSVYANGTAGTGGANGPLLAYFRDSSATNTNTSFGPVQFASGPGPDFQIGKKNINTTTYLQIRLANGPTELVTVDDSGNVGIGTIYPVSRLTVMGNVGIGTTGGPYTTITAPVNGLIVQGNVGIGTFNPFGGQLIIPTTNGNVGIGSLSPGQALDVTGTARMTGLTLTGNGAANGNVLVGNSVGVGTWMASSTLGITGGSGTNYWLLNGGNNVGINTTQAVGIGTSFVGGAGEAKLSVMNGNVGIGTWIPGAPLDVYFGTNRGEFYADSLGFNTIKIGNAAGGMGFFTNNTVSMELGANGGLSLGSTYFGTDPGSGNMIVQGNIGIGSLSPGQVLDVKGTARMAGFTLTGNGAGNGNVLVGNSVGVGTWMPVSTLGAAGGTNYWLLNGGSNVGINTTQAVGIGTSFVGGTGEATLSVMNGNVGIGTWVPSYLLQIGSGSNMFGFDSGGTLYLGTSGGALNNNGLVFQESGATQIYNDNSTAGSSVQYMGGVSATSHADIVSANASGTTDSIRFLVGNSGATEAMRIQDNSGTANVGIGSITPGQLLDVQGTVRMKGLTLTGNGAGNGSVLVGNSIGVGTWMPVSTLGAAGGSNYWLLNGGTNVGINTTQAVGIGTSFVGGTGEAALSVMNGKVGIGTWVPIVPLQVVGIGTLTANGGGLIVTNGNVGIGTTVPGYPLDVNGGSNSTDDWAIHASSNTTAPGGSFITIDNTNAAAHQSGFVLANQGAGKWYIVNSNLSNTTDDFGIYSGTLNQTIFAISPAGNVGIGTITPQGGFVVTNGNVGIGTWIPTVLTQINGAPTAYGQALVEVTDSTAPGSFMMIGEGSSNLNTFEPLLRGASNTYTGTGIALQGQISAGIDAIGDPQEAAMLLDVERIGDTAIQAANLFSFASNDVSMMMINKNGNVGIGTISPFGGGLIVTNGNVGIGTLVPGQLLDVKGTVRMLGFNIANNAGAGKVLTSDASGNGTWGAAGAGSNYWLLNGGAGNVGINTSYAVGIGTSFVGGTGEAALSVMNGNVGIGTWKPGAALDFRYYAAGGGVNSGIGFGAGGGSSLVLYQNSSNSVQFNIGAQMNFDDSFGRGISIFPGHAGEFQHYGDDASTATEFFQFNTDANITGLATANGGLIQTDSVFAPPSGTFNYSSLMINDTINQTGTSAGITRGILVNPILTSTRDFRAIETSIGNVGIGTISGNLGIGSQWPGQRLDVQGTARMSGFTLTGNGAANGNVLVGNSVGVGTWMPSSTLGITGGSGTNYWLLNGGNNVGINTTQAVGIGTSFVGGIGEAKLSVMNGNVGIGTWIPAMEFDIEATGFAGDMMTIGDTNGTYFIVSGGGNKGGIETSNISPINPTLNIWSGAASGSAGTQFNHIGINDSYTSGTGQLVQLWADSGDGQFNPGSGNGVYNMLEVDPNIDQTGTATGITRAIFINPNNPAAHDFRALETSVGNVGIGTISGNLGIGSQWPGQRLDVQGTVRVIGFNMANGAGAGKILTSDASGNGTWGTAGAGSNYWLLNGGSNVGINTTQAVGIGTSFVGGTGEAALSVMNGNVGIGTWVPADTFQVGKFSSNSSGFEVDSNGNVGIGTTITSFNSLTVMNGNVGIGTFTAQVPFQVTINQPTNTDMGISNINNNSAALAEIDALSNAGTVQLGIHSTTYAYDNGAAFVWNQANTDLYFGTNNLERVRITAAGNVGIGTTTPVGGLAVMNGNVGIGTWVPGNLLQINGPMPTSSSNLFSVTDSLAPSGFFDIGNSTNGANEYQPQITAQSSGYPGNALILLGLLPAAQDVLNGIDGAMDFQVARSDGSAIQTTPLFSFFNNSGVSVLMIDKSGNVGIGTATPFGGKLIIPSGNVGIGSLAPGQLLDVQGTVRMKGLTLTGNGAGNGNVLVGNAVGVGTWMPVSTLGAAGGSNYWLLNGGGNVGINTTQAVGIGTSFVGGTGEAALAVLNGNVGIGTWVPNSGLQLNSSFAVYRTGTATSVSSAGQVIIGVTNTTSAWTITLANTDAVPGRVIIIKDESGGAATHNITVSGGGKNIDGVSTVTISANYGVIRVYSDGNNWFTF